MPSEYLFQMQVSTIRQRLGMHPPILTYTKGQAFFVNPGKMSVRNKRYWTEGCLEEARDGVKGILLPKTSRGLARDHALMHSI